LNFTKDDFEEGATSWSHLKKYQLSHLLACMNGASYAVGEKPKKSMYQSAAAKRGGGGASNNTNSRSRYNAIAPVKLINNEKMEVFLETLFHRRKRSRVIGFRFYFFEIEPLPALNNIGNSGDGSDDAGLADLPNLLSIIHENNNEMSSSSSSSFHQPSLLHRGLMASFPECQQVMKSFSVAVTKLNKTASKVGKDLHKSLKYMMSDTMQGLFTHIFRNYHDSDDYKIESLSDKPTQEENMDDGKRSRKVNNRYFVDDRDIGGEEDVSTLFSIDSAMLYGVINRVDEKQCNIHTYFKPSLHVCLNNNNDVVDDDDEDIDNNDNERTSLNKTTAAGVVDDDVIHIGRTELRNNDFIGFYNHDTTYYLQSKYVLPEFLYKMPLPHLIGSVLPYKEDQSRYSDYQAEHMHHILSNHFQEQGGAAEDNENCDEDGNDSTMDSLTTAVDDLILYGSDDDDSTTMVNENYIRKLRFQQRTSNIHSAYNEFNSDLQHPSTSSIRKTPMGIHSTVYEPKANSVLNAAREGRFAKLKSDSSARTIADYKRIQESIIESALLNSVKVTLEENSFFTCEYEKLWQSKFENPEYQSYFTQTRFGTRCLEDGAGGSDTNANDEGGFVESDDDDEDGNDEGGSKSHKIPQTEYDRKRLEFDEFLRSMVWSYDNVPNMSEAEKVYQSHLANGNIEYFREIIRKYRPVANDAETVLKLGLNLSHSVMQLEKDIFCRLFELNTLAYNAFEKRWYGTKHVIEKHKEQEAQRERKRLMDALVVECNHEFMTNKDVTEPCKELRTYFQNTSSKTTDGMTVIPLKGVILDFRLDLKPYDHCRVWHQKLYTSQDGLDVKSNFKNMDIIYNARCHALRHYIGQNFPAKMNIIMQGKAGCGKSFAFIQAITCMASGMIKKLNQVTSNSLLTNTNLSDYIFLFEELLAEYLGTESSNDGSNNHPNSKSNANINTDIVSLFKAILTCGESSKLRAQCDKDTNEVSQTQSTALLQVVMLCAINQSLAGRELAMLDRFITLQQTSSKDGKSPVNETPNMCRDHKTNKKIMQEAIDIHRIYYMTEMMMKANVLGCNPGSGVNMTGSTILINKILDHLQEHFNIPTSNPRKRSFVEEMARTKTINFAVWQALKSPLFRHLQFFPNGNKKDYMGYNPRLFIYGIVPFLFPTKGIVIDSLIVLSNLWQSDYLVDIMTHLVEESSVSLYMKESTCIGPELDMMQQEMNATATTTSSSTTSNNEKHSSNSSTGSMGRPQNLLLSSSSSNSAASMKQPKRRRGNRKNIMTDAAFSPFKRIRTQMEMVDDYNYIAIPFNTKKEAFMKKIATGAIAKKTDLSEKYVGKVLDDLSEEFSEELPSYMLNTTTRRLEVDLDSPRIRRKIIDFHWQKGGEDGSLNYLYVLVSFLKTRLPHLLSDEWVDDMSKIEDNTVSTTSSSKEKDANGETITAKSITPEMLRKDLPNEKNKKKKNKTTKKKSDQEEEGDDTWSRYDEMMQRLTIIDNESIEDGLISSIKSVLENPALEKALYIGTDENGSPKKWISEEDESILMEHYKNGYFNYITSEPVKKVVYLSEQFDDVKRMKLTRKQAAKDDIIYFDHHLSKITLERKPNGLLIAINNKSYQSETTKALLSPQASTSLFNVDVIGSGRSNSNNNMSNYNDGNGGGGGGPSSFQYNDFVLKKRIAMYNDSAVVKIREDIDWEIMKVHFMELCIKFECTTGNPMQQFMAFPLYMYKLTTDFYYQVMRKFIEIFPERTNDPTLCRLDYPVCDMIQDINFAHTQFQSKYHLQLNDQDKVIYFDKLAGANFENNENWLLSSSSNSSSVGNEIVSFKLDSSEIAFQKEEMKLRKAHRYDEVLKRSITKRMREDHTSTSDDSGGGGDGDGKHGSTDNYDPDDPLFQSPRQQGPGDMNMDNNPILYRPAKKARMSPHRPPPPHHRSHPSPVYSPHGGDDSIFPDGDVFNSLRVKQPQYNPSTTPYPTPKSTTRPMGEYLGQGRKM
jgi:hypothetical protein